MKNILILDTETTGLHPDKGAEVIEIGALLFNVEHKVVLQSISTFLETEVNPVENINHIKPEWTQHCDPAKVIETIASMGINADAIVAHNVEFDMKFMRTIKLDELFWHTPWICTYRSFEWAIRLERKRLQDICNAMGVHYIDAHRALADCNLLAQCLARVDALQQRLISASRGTRPITHHHV